MRSITDPNRTKKLDFGLMGNVVPDIPVFHRKQRYFVYWQCHARLRDDTAIFALKLLMRSDSPKYENNGFNKSSCCIYATFVEDSA
jgi:hypothetical protein